MVLKIKMCTWKGKSGGWDGTEKNGANFGANTNSQERVRKKSINQVKEWVGRERNSSDTQGGRGKSHD